MQERVKKKRKKDENKEKVKKKKTDENEKKERPEVLVGQFSSLGEEKTSSLVPGQFTASTLKSVTAIREVGVNNVNSVGCRSCLRDLRR